MSTSSAPYDLCTTHFLSLRVIKDTTTTDSPLSSDVGRNISPVITCQSRDRVELELDSTAARTPTPADPQSSVSERNTSPTITCPTQDGAGFESDSTTTPTPPTPLSQREAVLTNTRTWELRGAIVSLFAPPWGMAFILRSHTKIKKQNLFLTKSSLYACQEYTSRE